MTIPERGAGRARATRPPVVADRRARATALYLNEAMTWDQIAAAVGYASRGAARDAVMKELSARSEQHAEEIRHGRVLMVGRLMALLETWTPIARDPSHPLAVKAAGIVTRALHQLAQVMGAYAPAKVEMTQTLAPPTDADAQRERVMANLAQYTQGLITAAGQRTALDAENFLRTQQDRTNTSNEQEATP
ncbi:hypothetical protein ACIBSS_02825 [Micromonospora aurantiaca]|uniref:hypothetical protein n=1 Tax=Micromonospora aurantiaca (nom. illeg.) TaxID=47850 RepID=UPI0037B22CDB